MVSSLDSIPEELQDDIIYYLDRVSLFKFSRTSSKFNRLVIPRLYENVHFKIHSEHEPPKGFLPFSAHIFRAPHIACMVKSFSIREVLDWQNYHGLLYSTVKPSRSSERKSWSISPELEKMLRERINEVAQTSLEASEWYANIQENSSEDAVIALFLPRLSRLETLDLSTVLYYKYTMRMLQRSIFNATNLKQSGIFPNLRNVMICGQDSKYPMEVAMLDTCLGLPNLQNLYGYRIGGNAFQQDWSNMRFPHEPRTCSLTSIELRSCSFYQDEMSTLLQACKSLRRFIYDFGLKWSDAKLRIGEIREALRPHESSLEVLTLDHISHYLSSGNASREGLPLSLSAFMAVTHLKVSSVFIFHPDFLRLGVEPGSSQENHIKQALIGMLPPNLEILHITHSQYIFSLDDLLPALETLILSKRGGNELARLHRIIFDGIFRGHKRRMERATRVAAIATTCGIEVHIVHNSELDSNRETGSLERGWGMNETIEFEPCAENQVQSNVTLGVYTS